MENSAIIFFDTETTGKADFKSPILAKHQPRIVQMAFLVCAPSRSEITRFSFLIRPDGWSIPKQASDVHGITDERCESEGINIGSALPLFEAIANMQPKPFFVCHNSDFDRFMVSVEMSRANRKPPEMEWRCTMKEATGILKIPGKYGDFKWPSLTETHKHFFGKDFDGKHDAMGDVIACKDCYFAIQETLAKSVASDE